MGGGPVRRSLYGIHLIRRQRQTQMCRGVLACCWIDALTAGGAARVYPLFGFGCETPSLAWAVGDVS